MLSSIAGLLGDLNAALGRINALGTLPQELNQTVAEVRNLVDSVREAGNRWLGTLSLIAVVLAVWIAATYVALSYRWLSTGWSMLQGKPAD